MTEQEKKDFKSKYVFVGVTAFLVVAACVIFAFLVFRFHTVTHFLAKIFKVLEPVIVGFIIAFIMSPLANFIERHLNNLFKKVMKENTSKKLATISSVILSLLVFVLMIFLFFYLVVPQFIECINDLLKNLPSQIESTTDKIIKIIKDNRDSPGVLGLIITEGNKWIVDTVVPSLTQWLTEFKWASDLATGVGAVAGAVGAVINFLKNFVIGIIIALYLLLGKKQYLRQTRKFVFAIFKKKTAGRIIYVGKKANKIFNGFISGQLLDALIVAFICFIGVSVLDIPYAMLISVVIGVTNIIPIFGPYLGGIPCAVLVFLSEPIKGIYFVIFIVLLQLFDGNIIAPRILGSKTGIANFWVVFAITVGGGMFGVFGMVIGVPTFALIYYVTRMMVNYSLRHKNLPVSSTYYDSDILDKMSSANTSASESIAEEKPVAEGE